MQRVQAPLFVLAICSCCCAVPAHGQNYQMEPVVVPRFGDSDSAGAPHFNTTVAPSVPFMRGAPPPTTVIQGAGQSLNAVIDEALSMPGQTMEPCRFVRIEPANDQAAKTSDYFPILLHAVKGKLAHFTTMPIPVYFQPISPQYLKMYCWAALDMWEFRSNKLVRFVEVKDPAQARIQVCWQHNGASPNKTSDGAVTQMRWNSSKARGLPMMGRQTVYTVAPQVVNFNMDVLGTRPTEDQGILLRNVLAHEIGHALGIQTHSPEQGDLMYDDTDEYSRLSERDLNTLRKLYQTPPDMQL